MSRGLAVIASLAVTVLGIGIGIAAPDSVTAGVDYDCADFANQADAQEHLGSGDPHGLDGDNDGIACESLPCPCNSTVGPHPPPPPQGEPPNDTTRPEPYYLPMKAAKRVSKRLVRRAVNRHPRLDTSNLQGCSRRGERRVVCRLVARGSSADSRTTCRLRVAVRARNRRPVGRIASRRCSSRTLRRLSHARAKAAILDQMTALAGKRPALEVSRLSSLSFIGYAYWTRPAGGGLEFCEAPPGPQSPGGPAGRPCKRS